MNNENNLKNTSHDGGDGSGTPEKTFTQAEVDEIVKERLSRERKKTAKLFDEGYLSEEMKEREAALLKKELTYEAKERFEQLGYPGSLADLLNYQDKDSFEESFQRAVDIIKPLRKSIAEKLIGESSSGAPRTGQRENYNAEEQLLREAFGLK